MNITDINIKFICIEYKDFYEYLHKNISIIITSDYGVLLYGNSYSIRSIIAKDANLKNMFIQVKNLNTNNLETSNFTLNLPNNVYFVYTYYDVEPDKSIIIFNNYNYFPFIFMGLPNLKKSFSVKVEYKYKSVLSSLMSDSDIDKILSALGIDIDQLTEINEAKNIFLFNEYEGNYNYLSGTLVLRGWIYQIYDITITDDALNTYDLFQISPIINLDINTNIYFYDTSKLFSYVLYLNNYNFINYKTYPESYESLIVLIDYSLIETTDIIYSCVLEINMQTFNSSQLETNTPEYYNCFFFKNYTNSNYIVSSISVFYYDWEKYFINTFNPPEYHNIGSCYNDLYDKIIGNDANLNTPTILYEDWSRTNFDFIKLIRMINPNIENNYFNRFLQSKTINFDTIVNYLDKFYFVEYNVFKINNPSFQLQQMPNPKIPILNPNDSSGLYNYNYGYSNKIVYANKKNNPYNEWVNFNNNIMNSIRCKLIFLYGFNKFYSLDVKMYLNNYNIRIYNKKYEYQEKKDLIKMLLFLASYSWGIKLIFYNELNSAPPVETDYNLFLSQNSSYLFNTINLFKYFNQFDIFIETEQKNNMNTSQYLKFNINIKTNYYILFLNIDKNMLNYNELVFNYSQYLFKILKLERPNGNTDETKDLFYIGFQNILELNIFMNYIQYGIFNVNVKQSELKNYFNFSQGVIFCNYYNINNYWVLDKLPPPAIPANPIDSGDKIKIYFSINNLIANQVFLYGENMFDLTINIV